MAIRAPVLVRPNPLAGRGLKVWKWTAIDAADTITPLLLDGHYSDMTVYFLKGSAFGGNMSLTGSPDPGMAAATFTTLKDAETGLVIATKTADGVFQVLNGAMAYAPVAAAGVAAVDVWLLAKSTR